MPPEVVWGSHPLNPIHLFVRPSSPRKSIIARAAGGGDRFSPCTLSCSLSSLSFLCLACVIYAYTRFHTSPSSIIRVLMFLTFGDSSSIASISPSFRLPSSALVHHMFWAVLYLTNVDTSSKILPILWVYAPKGSCPVRNCVKKMMFACGHS